MKRALQLCKNASADADLLAIAEFFGERNPAATVKMLNEIEAQSERLAEFPHLGHIGRVAETRELVVPSTPFTVVYSVDEERVTILRVLHQARQWPGH